MMVSTGAPMKSGKLAESRVPQGGQVNELRTATPMEPEEITHIVLPVFMRAFRPAYEWEIDLRFADIAKAPAMTYYDHGTGTKQTVDLAKSTNLQQEIEHLQAEGNREMITHTTHI